MMKLKLSLLAGWALALAGCGCGCAVNETPENKAERAAAQEKIGKVVKTDAEWQAILTPEQYKILRRKGTEPAFCGTGWKPQGEGHYQCAGCGLELFVSTAKFDSGTGWPSFFQPVDKFHVIESEDRSYGMVRTSVECARCDGHLGHVFDDGPEPTGKRYCINSASLKFVAKAEGQPDEKKQ